MTPRNFRFRAPIVALIAAPLAAILVAANTIAAPLLIPGKQALYQRVLSVPGAGLHPEPGRDAAETAVPFTAYYVYERSSRADGEWLKVGTNRHDGTAGWIPAAETIAWNQGLTVAFRDPAGRDRALLYRDAESARKLSDESQLGTYRRLYEAAAAGSQPADSPVVAIQPPGELDIRKDFYLVPILQHEDLYLGNERARLLQVSSVPLRQADDAPAAASTRPTASVPPRTEDALSEYRAGLVFAIDSTLSMDPYIERTREAVRKIYDALGDAGILGNVNFGLVAFRDSPQAVPQLEYLTRTYVDLEQGRNPGNFLRRVDNLSAATFSSKDFIEDSYAGVKQALDDMDWEGHAARYLVLITDAGPRNADDPLSSTGLDAEALSRLARQQGVAIFVLHLLTEATQSDHAYAAEQYRELARFPGIGSLYYAVPTGDVREFGHVLDTLAGQIAMQVQMAAASQPLPLPAEVDRPETITPTPANPRLAELQDKVARLGYALQMEYLQRSEGGKVPNVFNAWLLDRDIRDPRQRTLDVQVLLTRDQLSDLHDILKNVLLTAEEGLLSPQNFLNELKSLAATIARDPDQLGTTTATTAGSGNSLADLGFMREYIEDLPYTGEVMNLSLEDWETWPAREQIDFLHRLEDKISYYRALHDNT
ncbi:MAG: VWA domain-containing protein, partial [Gammaproteobacteria bacterium]|nr:VWA domain-containing protein [Gammaproteobacteria bacterium]